MFILGRKLKMSQIWKGEKVVPVTIIEAVPNTIGILRAKEKDGYRAVQLSLKGKKREFRVRDESLDVAQKFPSGSEVGVSSFAENDLVRVSGTSKGRGFQGVVKRHGFGGGPKTHGQKNRYRAPGSIGNTAAQRVIPGRRMAGHMGNERITVKNLLVVGIDAERNLLMLRGAVPGSRGGFLEIERIGSKKK